MGPREGYLDDGEAIRAKAMASAPEAKRNGCWTTFEHECWFLWLLDNARHLTAAVSASATDPAARRLAAEWQAIEDAGWDEYPTIKEGGHWTSPSRQRRNAWLMANGLALLAAARNLTEIQEAT